jgi:pimeloyl-ACP methyl ester carboxylesterase
VLPLVLCHGWPGSFWRYTKVIPLLTDPAADGGDPADAFDVVVPDMPGCGYSDRPAGPPLDTIAVADPPTSASRRGHGWNAPPTSCGSRSPRAAGTSHRSRNPRYAAELRAFFRPYRA